MNYSFSSQTTTIGTTCTNYAAGQVTITVPSAGTILVQIQVWFRISHTNGLLDAVWIATGTTPTDCGPGFYAWRHTVDLAETTYVYDLSAFVQRPISVGGAGTYTFYLNGFMTAGQDAADVFYYDNMVATFYPA